MDNYGKSKELSQKMKNCIRVYSDMLGAPDAGKENTYGFVPGLQMTVEQQMLEQQLDKLEEGIFQVLFTGGFSAGKSTLLNSLMRKDILRTAITAETAVITKIVFGQDEKIIIYEKKTDAQSGKKTIRELDVQQFFEEYRVSQDQPDKFQNIDYVVLQQPGEGIGGTLVQMVDSPGTENSTEDTLAARQFAQSASAIVHLINSTMPFVLEDKEYIASHYANKHMRNIFFVCNRYDALNEQAQEELKKSVRQQLKDVFTDKNGRFDEELFTNRVFYTDAYHSLYARIGKEVRTPYGMMKCDDRMTGVPEFEEALNRFLTADDRDKEAFRGYMSQLAGKYVSAMNKIESILETYRKGKEELLAEQKDFEGKRKQLEVIIQQIEESCRNCVFGILSSAKSEYGSCMNRINIGWDEYFKKTTIPFGLKDMAGLAFHRKNDAKVKEMTKPFADAVQKYVMEEFDKMSKSLSGSMDAQLKTLERQLNIQQEQLENLELPISVDSLRQALLGGIGSRGKTDINAGDMNTGNLFQIILGIIGMDPEIMADGMNGKNSNGKVIIDFLMKNVLEYIAWYVVAWPIGIGMIIYRIAGMIKGVKAQTNSRAADILIGMRNETVEALQAEQERYIMELETQLAAITRAGRTMADSIHLQVEDYSISLKDTIERLNQKSDSLQAETERTDKIRMLLLKNISEVNQILNGEPLTDEKVRSLAVQEQS